MNPFRTVTKKHDFKSLLAFLLLYIFASPFIAGYPSLSILAHLLLSSVLLLSVRAIHQQQNHRTVATGLLIPLLVIYWLGIYKVIPYGKICSNILFAPYFALLVSSYIRQLARTQKITLDAVYATLCLYLIIALFWGALYTILYEFNPLSFSGTLLQNTQGSNRIAFNYFSIITLTTLGYGDISPQTLGAGSLCQMEAIMGQFFSTVIVAWLIGTFVAKK